MLRSLILLAALAGTLSSCGGSSAPREPAAAAPEAAAADSLPALVDGDVDAILAEVRRPGARGTLVNVWATWCIPCRKEFPDLMAVSRAYADSGLRLVLVSADFDESRDEARRFLRDHGVVAPSFFKVGDDQAFIDGLSERWSGALPVTLAYDADGRLMEMHEGGADAARLETLARVAVGAAVTTTP